MMPWEPGRRERAKAAFLLGFSEVSTFHRAVKRWTGGTPAACRRGQLFRTPGTSSIVR
jgi:AraC-like DNA-binding protein